MATGEEKAQNEQKYWCGQLSLADKRVRHYLQEARDVVQLYEAQKKSENAFNILYSNTETLLPALYNALPRPIAQRRFKDADPVSKAVCDTLTRALEYTIDSPDAEYEAFDDVVRSAVLGALVAGLGITWFRYDFESEQETTESVDKGIAAEGTQFSDGDPTGEAHPEVPQEKVIYESVCAQDVSYRDIRWGFSRKWKNVPWVARRHVMNKTDVAEQFGKALAEKVEFQEPAKEDGDDEKGSAAGDANDEENRGSAKVADVWEVWHKASRKVLFVSPQYKDGLLGDQVDDPLGLSGFYPCPEPLQFTMRLSSLIPVPPYKFYENQAKELNKITLRINRVVGAMKVRGFFNGGLKDDLSTLLTRDDNTLLAAPSAAMFDKTNLANQIWLMPLQELAGVLQTLIAERQQIKQTIYEITGISDILRGSTVASETATAQNLKSQWGTLRLKRSQKRVQMYVRSCMRIQTEIIAGKFSMETLKQVTGLPFMMPEQKQQLQALIAPLKQQAMLSPPQQPGQPPDQGQQQLQQLQQQVQQIDWGQVMEVLRSNILRGYRIDIETNSTIDADATEDRQNINELLTGLGQAMQAFGPAMQEGTLPMGAFKAILLAIARRYEFGSEVEDELNAMPNQLPQKPDPQMQKAQLELQQAQMEGQQKQQQMKEQQRTDQMKMELDRAALQQKAMYEAKKHQMMMQKMDRDEVMAQAEHQRKLEEMAMQAAMPRQPAGQAKSKSQPARARN